jgi:hypothetical protein
MVKIYKKDRNKARKAAYRVIIGISWEGGILFKEGRDMVFGLIH